VFELPFQFTDVVLELSQLFGSVIETCEKLFDLLVPVVKKSTQFR
jgi:hypothetical protein